MLKRRSALRSGIAAALRRAAVAAEITATAGAAPASAAMPATPEFTAATLAAFAALGRTAVATEVATAAVTLTAFTGGSAAEAAFTLRAALAATLVTAATRTASATAAAASALALEVTTLAWAARLLALGGCGRILGFAAEEAFYPAEHATGFLLGGLGLGRRSRRGRGLRRSVITGRAPIAFEATATFAAITLEAAFASFATGTVKTPTAFPSVVALGKRTIATGFTGTIPALIRGLQGRRRQDIELGFLDRAGRRGGNRSRRWGGRRFFRHGFVGLHRDRSRGRFGRG